MLESAATSIEQAFKGIKTAVAEMSMKVRIRRCLTFGWGAHDHDQPQQPPQPGDEAAGSASDSGMPAAASVVGSNTPVLICFDKMSKMGKMNEHRSRFLRNNVYQITPDVCTRVILKI